MKLATHAAEGRHWLAAVDPEAGTLTDLQSLSQAVDGTQRPYFASMLEFIESGDEALDMARQLLQRADRADARHNRALKTARLLSPLPRPTQLRDFSVFPLHLQKGPKVLAGITRDLGGATPPISMPQGRYPEIYDTTPIFYFSNRLNVVGHDAHVEWPAKARYLDFELELAVCIGKSGRDIERSNALQHVFGYTVFNDVSARDIQALQMPGGLGPCKAKSYDGCNVLGPWIVTRDEMADPYALDVEVRVNGEVWNRSTTAGMLHGFEDMIAFASQGETLYPGEVFGSGTVGGCCGLELERWIRHGDSVELEIKGIGTLRNTYGHALQTNH